MNKLLFIVACFLMISFAASKILPIKKVASRTISPEALSLELEYLGTCREFETEVLGSVRISNYQGDSCLPINVDAANDDINDLNAHYFCTNTDEKRSVVHFVEIFGVVDDVPIANFVLSLIPNSPFRVLTTRTSLARRPNCEITEDYCNSAYAVVGSCSSNHVQQKKGYVVNHDRIYITSQEHVSFDCKKGDTPNCCLYVAPHLFNGICPYTASEDILLSPKEKEHKEHEENTK